MNSEDVKLAFLLLFWASAAGFIIYVTYRDIAKRKKRGTVNEEEELSVATEQAKPTAVQTPEHPQNEQTVRLDITCPFCGTDTEYHKSNKNRAAYFYLRQVQGKRVVNGEYCHRDCAYLKMTYNQTFGCADNCGFVVLQEREIENGLTTFYRTDRCKHETPENANE